MQPNIGIEMVDCSILILTLFLISSPMYLVIQSTIECLLFIIIAIVLSLSFVDITAHQNESTSSSMIFPNCFFSLYTNRYILLNANVVVVVVMMDFQVWLRSFDSTRIYIHVFTS